MTEAKTTFAGQKYKAVEAFEKGKLRLVERTVPSLKPLEVLVKVAYCGLCHGDVHGVEGHFPGSKYPVVPGHEIVGTVVEVGSEVKRFKVGDRVGRGWHGGHCFQCDSCMKGDFLACVQHNITGITMDGGYSQYAVCPFESLARVPDSLKFEDASGLTCAGLTCYNGLRKTGAVAGQLVAIQGIGGLGHLGIQIARKMGFEVVAVSSGSAKEKEAKELGAHHYIDASKGAPAEQLKKLGGARVIIATAFDAKAISSLIEGLGVGGELLVAGADHHSLTVTPLQLIGARRKVVGVASGHTMDNEDTLKFCGLTGVKNIGETFPLDKFQEAYDKMLKGQPRFRVVLNPWALSTDKPAAASKS